MRFRDRSEAGRLLARSLQRFKSRPDVLVLALPRGGVPVAYEVALNLKAPLDVFVVRKLGVPGRKELAMGAIATGGIRALNESVIRLLNIPQTVIEAVATSEGEELQRRERLYRGGKPPLDVKSKTIILIDDGLATGSTMKAAIAALRRQNPARIIVAVPLAPPETCRELEDDADEVVCPVMPEPFYAIGEWYESFEQTTDSEVSDLIRRAA
jgi:predicted phosphoribosyltransferase